MPRREHNNIQANEWTLIIDCPFNGSNTNYAQSGITLSGGTTFATDPTDSTIQVASIKSDAQSRLISLTQFPREYQTRYRMELDWYCVGIKSYNNIVDASNSGGASSGIFTQYNSSKWYFGNKVDSGDNGLIIVNASLCPINNWYHLILQRVGSIAYVCLKNSNDTIIAQTEYENAGPFIASNNNANTLKIGRGSYSNRYINGYIKDLKVWLHEL